MGISDRHYIRDQPGRSVLGGPGGGPLAAMRMFSVNTWIIIICVAVFVVDGMTPVRLVPSGNYVVPEGVQIPPTAAIGTIDDYRGYPGVDGFGLVPLYERPGGVQVGFAEVYVMRTLESFLHYSTLRGLLPQGGIQFWRLLGFQFLHSQANFGHLIFNMIGLFFFGPLVERYLGSKRYLAFYLLCGIFGALLYSVLNLGGYVATLMLGEDVRIPGLLFNSPATPLIGASAGVFGILMAGAYLAPNATVLLFFVIPMKLRTLAYALVAFALYTVIFHGRNAGGEAGHLGGAIAGFYFIRNVHHLHGFFDIIGRVDPTSHHYRHRPGRARAGPRVGSGSSQAEVDRILDKINREGLQSLTEREKQTLREASRPGGGGG